MVGLLVLSLALAGPAAALDRNASAGQTNPSRSLPSEFEITSEGVPQQSFDKMELHPSSDICYKIRAYVFSQDATPKFLRETTCGPKVTQTQKTNGFRPIVVTPEKTTADSPAAKK